MVAYGEALKRAAEESPFDPRAYLDYEALKALLYDLEKLHFRPPVEENAMSLTVTGRVAKPEAPSATSSLSPRVASTRTRTHTRCTMRSSP